jgi:uncharacterized membrane protein YedE/YeeE
VTVDLASFTPVRSLAGGLLIGASSALLFAGSGRIAGITGVAAGLLPQSERAGRSWRAAFALGLLGAAVLLALVAPASMSAPGASLPTLIVAGLLVGVGTRLANGCTSGHGVSGLSRLSPRSLVAVATFMLAAGLTVFVTHARGGVSP